MLTVIQRVSRAAVRVDGEVVGAVERGAMLLVAVERGDVEADAIATAKKIASLRFFPGATPMDRTLAEVGGGVLVVSQFTLAGSLRKGRRPSFDGAELPERARALYEAVAEALRAEGLPVATGRFAAHMEVELVNDGPVTFLLRSVAGQVQ
ncbi:D-aminoacyl-tRNA deacylase [Nannocystis sp. SCPEA4]|uniref:D-aminoacyl-tRNA deacylase n=1 Tax=Nannocystis sp. SCPEA4 TaxID=2996787 RepID=UPI0022715A78|nr:D-aminoacyl-tRNA deacylase [Nannocystis sp. SCPEA4]MCY1062113.1 D-aminoacyl-tRNA deacylase [Nannocystis sp. SCPEA4]